VNCVGLMLWISYR